jgi:translocation and assembly module TamA
MRARSLAASSTGRRLLRGALFSLLSVALTCGSARGADELRYDVTFAGAPDSAALSLIKRVSKLESEKHKGAANPVALERRASGDVKRFVEVLNSEGYYDAAVHYRIDSKKGGATVAMRVDPGPRYPVSDVAVHLVGTVADETLVTKELDRFRAIVGRPARARAILDAEVILVAGVIARGYPLARITAKRYVADHAIDAVQVDISLDTGPRARFGTITYVGLVDVDETYVRNRLPWKEGDIYDPAKVDRARRALSATGLFAHVGVDHADRVEEDGMLPMSVTVVEGKFRTVSIGVRYDSMLGAGGGASWEHRNVLGGGERFRVTGDVAEAGYSGVLEWREPDFFRPGYTLSYRAGYAREDTTAYKVERAYAGTAIEVPLSDTLVTTAGVTLEWSPVQTKAREADSGERDQDETFLLIGFPLTLIRSTTDSLLEPTRGTRVEFSATPYTEISGDDLAFSVLRVTPSFYLPFQPPLVRRAVLATRLSVGSIGGAKRDQIPADKRFYAGGGGSIRGYEYQRVGPLDDDDEPLGGRSLLEVGTELRLRITDSFGIVGFFEGGNVYQSLYPDLDDVMRWGTGGGLRYYSPVGPFRLDIGTPVNGRGGIDHTIQVYISLGEAF